MVAVVGILLTADDPDRHQPVWRSVGALMPERQHYSQDEILRMVGAPAVVSRLPGGGVMVMRGGVVGIGRSRDEAESDWRQRLRNLAGRPKPPAADPVADTDLHVPLVSPTESAPSG